ncbi:hypothetical protein [Fictibacillus sp. BK138]|uniref:hypothetical protein n=1 Tax=Fictibacillus sp. BK138 TaxID=2512121 RepID=UPI001028DEDC|nr:hypothetical protein [Fictibacillus sp. BK138]RZT23784.1 hypothetical protein EV282_2880 [Fictibacillus sp. BK138]
MRAGNIKQFTRFSQFTNVGEFNEHKKRFLDDHPQLFSKSEFKAFELLSQYSVVVPGVANAKIDTLVERSGEKGEGVSRASIIRMLRKAKKAGILTVHKTYRSGGGFAHNVFVFNRFDPPSETGVIQREENETPCDSRIEQTKCEAETINLLRNHQDQKINIRKESASTNTTPDDPSLKDLDETFTPDNVPKEFIQAVKPFYNRAIEIYRFWQKARLAYNKYNFDMPLEFMTHVVIDAFKTTIFHYKHRKINTTFVQYFYGTLNGMFGVQKRKEHMAKKPRYNWLEDVACD